MKRLRRILGLSFLVSLSISAYAQSVSNNVRLQLGGEPKPDGTWQLTLHAVAPGASYLKVISQPSGTPMLLVLDHARGDVPAPVRQAWTEAGGSVVETSLAETAPRVGGLRRPASDTGIRVVAKVGVEEIVLADGRLGAGPFSFSVEYREGAFTHCCENPPCGFRCVTCKGPAFTCCGSPCEIACGHIDCP